jgi:hypothetical protein
MSKDFFKVKKGLNLDPTSSASIASPEVGDIIVDSSDNNKLKRYDDVTASWKDVGSGVGGINYISSNSDFEGGTVGYATYADAAGEAPVDGTGGTATFVSIGTDSVSPLRGTKSGLISKTANNAQGQGVSYDFTIDAADQAQILRISFDYSTSVDYADGNIRVYVYDVFNSRLIEVIDRDLLASAQGKFVGTFQTSPDSLSYRLIFHIADNLNLAYTVELDNVIVGPQTIVKGAIVTDWEDLSGVTVTNFTASSIIAKFRREGDSARVSISITSSSVLTGALRVNIPSTLPIDESKITGANTWIGEAVFSDFSANVGYLGRAYQTALNSQILQFYGPNTGAWTSTTSTPAVMASGDVITVDLLIPIQGWSSNVVLSEDAGNREIVTRVRLSGTQTISSTAQTIVAFDTISVDTTSSFNTSTNTFTAPETGYYDVSLALNLSGMATEAFTAVLNISGTQNSTALTATPSGTTHIFNCSKTVYLLKGYTVSVTIQSTADTSYNVISTAERTFLSIAKRSSPQTIAASEVVACRYTSNSGQNFSTGVNTAILFEDVSYDTHGAYNTSTGIFTAPQTGYYLVNANIQFNSLTAGTGLIRMFAVPSTGIAVQGDYRDIEGVIESACLNKVVFLEKGTTLGISAIQSNGAGRAIATDSSRNSLEITKLNGVS